MVILVQKKQKNNYGNIDINLLNYGLDTSITEVLILCLLNFFLPGIFQLTKVRRILYLPILYREISHFSSSISSLIAPHVFNNL